MKFFLSYIALIQNKPECIMALFRDAEFSNWSEKNHRLSDCYRDQRRFNLYWFVTQ